jgi:hypothetical protein
VSTPAVERTILSGETHCADTDCTLVGPSTTTTTAPATSTSTTATIPTTTSTTLPPSWAAIHAAVIEPSCGGCHGAAGAGGLGGLGGCDTGYAALVGVTSHLLPTMLQVTPGAPPFSFLMHKLDGTHNDFAAQCAGGSCGGTMPLNRPQLAPVVRDGIRAWILGGAVNDCP